MATLVTLDQLKARLRITSTDEDADLQDLLDQAEALVVNWCSVTAASAAVAAAWLPGTVPRVVIAAILVQAGELDRFRGDDADAPPRAPDGEVLAVTVRELLRPYHDLAMA
jgi:hypothetical protein